MEIFMPGDLERLGQMRNIDVEDEFDTEEEDIEEIENPRHSKHHHKHEHDHDEYEKNCLCKCKQGCMKEECKKDSKEALRVIRESIYDEMYDVAFYEYLLRLAETEEERCILKSIIEDETKHHNLLKKVYCDITGKEMKIDEVIVVDKPKTYIGGIKKAHHGEIKAGEKYRKVREGLKDECHRDILLEIMTDEFKHANWFNYILLVNLERRCG